MNQRLEIVTSLTEINPEHWNHLGEADYPFTRHEFLQALEQQNCLLEFGWQPVYFTFYEDEILTAAIPCYIKNNSYGELVFDHNWAQAYERSGRAYYPKLVSAIPYTPATGPRFLLHTSVIDDQQKNDLKKILFNGIKAFCEDQKLSGWHLLFERETVAKSLSSEGLLFRYDCQFHWSNRNYNNFDDFLSHLTSRKRKNIRKERAQIAQHNLTIKQLHGHELTPQQWTRVYRLYAGIFERKHGTATLSEHFFQTIGQTLKHRVMVVLAFDQHEIIAASVFFVSDSTLYGRVWGCDEYYQHLHFECCYYQGIDYCIKNGLLKFDPGAQGEHKISRGFLPTKTCSAHWLVEPEFHKIIDNFLQQEERYINEYCRQQSLKSPYRQDS